MTAITKAQKVKFFEQRLIPEQRGVTLTNQIS